MKNVSRQLHYVGKHTYCIFKKPALLSHIDKHKYLKSNNATKVQVKNAWAKQEKMFSSILVRLFNSLIFSFFALSAPLGWSRSKFMDTRFSLIGGSSFSNQGQNRFSKHVILSVAQRILFIRSQGGSQRVTKDSVNLTFNAFLDKNVSSMYIMVP